jgi:hypothetical protein
VAELGPLREKLGEVLGLALAAPVVVGKVEARVEDGELLRGLAAMRRDAEAVQGRCAEVAAAWGDEIRWGVLAHAQYVQRKAGEMEHAWFRAATDAVQAYEFLAMGEAGEIAATAALGVLNGGGDEPAVDELVAWALPIQERHLQQALDGCARAAAVSLAVA